MKTTLIKRPLITEKTLQLASEQNVFTFEVDYKASKTQIKEAIQQLFDVKVEQINTQLMPSKRRKTGKKRLINLSTASKKALIKLQEGQTIELFDIT